MSIKVTELFLGRYISFHDEVRMKDLVRAFERAVADAGLDRGERFVCITHSTGGPVAREWWRRYYQPAGTKKCPMSHLIMLAPANYGSALAVLGKGKLSRMSSWWSGVEPGQGVLDWLVLGSAEAWDLNLDWIQNGGKHIGTNGVFPFVLTGESIDRKFYDNLNSYTGELGSDGVVRVSAANLRGNYVRLVQEAPVPVPGKPGKFHAPALQIDNQATVLAPPTPLRVLAGKSHSGNTMGIMKSVKAEAGTAKDQETVDAIFRCMQVASKADYNAVIKDFAQQTAEVQREQRLEIEDRWLRSDAYFVHDQFSMVIFRVKDHEGFAVTDFDILLTGGKEDDPNHLPKGFFADRQLNNSSRNTVTYYVNHSVMVGCDAVIDPRNGTVVRAKLEGTNALGFRITARPDEGFTRYMPCSLSASAAMLEQVIDANNTTLVDIVLRRVVGEEAVRFDRGADAKSFKGTKPGDPLRD